jgi:hypothetical protein
MTHIKSFGTLRAAFLAGLTSFLLACGGAPAGAPAPGGGTTGGEEPSVALGTGGGNSFSAGSLSATLISGGSNPVWEVSGVVADANGIAVTDVYTVEFSSTCVATNLSSLSVASVNSVAGRVSVTYTAGTCDGIDTVTASVQGETATASVDLDIDDAIAGGSGGGGSTGNAQLGNGSGTGFVSGELSASVTNLEAGDSTFISANVVDANNALLQDNVAVTFSSSCIADGLSAVSPSEVTSSSGLATTEYTAQGCSGTDTVTATAIVNGVQLSASIDLVIAVDSVLGVQFESVSEPILAIAGIGGTETALVTFQLIGSQGNPIVGEEVTFEITNSAGGAAIAPGTESDSSDESGFISTVVQSGTVNSSLRVVATHSGSGVQGSSDDITISTGVAVKRSFDLAADIFNPRAANHNGIAVNLTINASDQFGNPPPDGTRVSFRSVEIGIIEPSCALSAGECTVTWESSGDRDAITDDTLGRPMRATILAFMSGAENYTDFNGNGFFDDGNASEVASVQDLPEAYVDQNEDGVHNPGEDFVDSFLNNPAPTDSTPGGTNGAYDAAGDGSYNGPCSEEIQSDCPLSELQSTIISDSVVISLSSEFGQLCSTGTLPAPGNVVTFPVNISGVIICDVNENSLPGGTSFTWSATNGSLDGSTTGTVPTGTTNPLGIASLSAEASGSETSGTLRLTISSEGQDTIISWPWSL